MARLISEKDAAEYVGRKVDTLRLDRRKGVGPAYYRVGRRILYRVGDLEAFLSSRRVEEKNRAA